MFHYLYFFRVFLLVSVGVVPLPFIPLHFLCVYEFRLSRYLFWWNFLSTCIAARSLGYLCGAASQSVDRGLCCLPRATAQASWSSVWDRVTRLSGTRWPQVLCRGVECVGLASLRSSAWALRRGDSCWCRALSAPPPGRSVPCARHKWSPGFCASSVCPAFSPAAVGPGTGMPSLQVIPQGRSVPMGSSSTS